MDNNKFITTDSIILKYTTTGEINRFFTFISAELGVETATAFGAEKLKSRFCPIIQPFVEAKLVLRKSKENYYKLEDVIDIEINDFLKADINFLYLSYFFSDVILNSYISREDFKKYYYLVKYSITIMREKGDYKKAYLFFIVKYFFLYGYNFSFNECKECGKKDELLYFNYYRGGVLCSVHNKAPTHAISSETCRIFNDLFEKKFSILIEENIPDINFSEIYPITQELIFHIFNKKLITINTINNILG